MLKNNRGVTLTALIIMVLVLLIIVGTTVICSTDILRNSDKSKLKSNLYLVKARAETLLEDYLFDGTDNLGTEATDSQIEAVGFDEYTGNYIYRVWDATKLTEEGIDVDSVKDSEVFIVQYDLTNDSVDVASTIGYEDEDGNEIYILSELD